MADQIPIISLGILNKTKDRTYQNQRAGDVESPKSGLPAAKCRLIGALPQLESSLCWIRTNPSVKDRRGKHEKCKEDELHAETANCDVFTRSPGTKAGAGHGRTTFGLA